GLLWDGGQPPAELRFAARAALLAMAFCGKAGGVRISFEDDLSHGGRKLGLGGSAAASVLAVRAVCALADRRAGEDEILALAVAAHWAEQGGSGSGADVAAAALGGILEVRSRFVWPSAEAAMAALGEDARVPIATPELAKACALASAAGAAGKPSGAGGGDCAVVVAFGDETRDRAEAALRPHFPVFRVAPA